MATSANTAQTASSDQLIVIKVVVNGKDENRRFKLPLKDLGATSLPDKLRTLLAIPSSQTAVFERYSDSSSSFVTLDSSVPSVYKQLYRAAKAKSKLKIRVTVTDKQGALSFEAPKVELGLPERLTTRSYVHPYISDPVKAEAESSPREYLPTLEQLKTTPSAATLVPSTKPSVEVNCEEPHDRMPQTQKPSYYWPVSHDGGYSDATKSAFENKGMADTAAKGCDTEKNTENEAPVPRFFTDRGNFLAHHANISQKLEAIHNSRARNTTPGIASFTICCNNCNAPIPDAHWHCSKCARGDFDLCGECIGKGHLCEGGDHWLIKRFVRDGKVINSTTETIAPKKPTNVDTAAKIPGAFTPEPKREASREAIDLSRTCNSCVGVFEESNFVTCVTCDDYDLCIPCHIGMKHGHHPSHTFAPASKDTYLNSLALCLCAPGRNALHQAICDGCDKEIYGVRHKCVNCPDWDFCSICVQNARKTHPGHRFVPLYEPISVESEFRQLHSGIYCDGPLCIGKHTYISGDRYKCAVCHDTDFCANCEALPKLPHNKTHPLIKFKTPVRGVSVTTMGEKPNGQQMCTMGDQFPQTSSKSTETVPAAPSANAATQVHTIAEVKPTVTIKEEKKVEPAKPVAAPELQAHFVRDTVLDGSCMPPSQQFEQIWTLRNPGPHAWPAGCCVCFVGGDGMLDVNTTHPSHVAQIYKATKSNIIDRVVEVGEEVDFKVVMRTPEREGKAISYWRLKDASGLPFGHKLWCDVDVRPAQVIAPSKDHVDSELTGNDPKPTKVEEETKEEDKQRESKMIFPKLDKESPMSSTHEEKVANATVPAVTHVEKDLLEDVESLELDEDSDSDDAFLTDEEYELIATDDEMEEAKNGKK